MPIYVGVNGEAKLVTQAYIGNKNNYAIPLYLQDIIPKGYTPLSHIYTTAKNANGYINTGIEITVYTKVVLVFTPFYNIKLDDNCLLLRSTTNNSDYSLGYIKSQNNPNPYCRWGSIQEATATITSIKFKNLSNISSVPNTYYTYIMCNSGNKDCYIKSNDTKTSIGNNTNSSTITNAGPIRLIFSQYSPFCYCAIYKNVLTDISPTVEFYPCIKNNTQEPGIYDTVSGNFYTNSNFASGAVIPKYNFPSFEED